MSFQSKGHHPHPPTYPIGWWVEDDLMKKLFASGGMFLLAIHQEKIEITPKNQKNILGGKIEIF
jgi:hypothetical protein